MIVLNGSSSFSPLETASDCHELFLRGETTSGVYTIQPVKAEPFKVFCEMTAGKMDELDELFESVPALVLGLMVLFGLLHPDGGWTVIQRRRDGSVDFDHLWEAYVKGFGSLTGKCSFRL